MPRTDLVRVAEGGVLVGADAVQAAAEATAAIGAAVLVLAVRGAAWEHRCTRVVGELSIAGRG